MKQEIKLKQYQTCEVTPLKTIKNAAVIDIFNLAAKIAKFEVDKLDINGLNNFPSSLNDLEKKGDELDDDKLKTVPIDSKK